MPSLALACRLSAVSRASRRPFSPASLFSSGEQGVWYDPSDYSTMFEDAAGTTPITTPLEKPVGLMLDKSKGLVLGPELVTNGDFSNGTTGWTSSAVIPAYFSAAFSSGKAQLSLINNTTAQFSQALSVISGKTYKITASVKYISGTVNGSVGVRTTNSAITSSNLTSQSVNTVSDTEVSFYYLAASTTTVYVGAYCYTTNCSFSIDNISVRELPGNHATQSTTTSRPTLSARYNLLTKTEQFDDAAWKLYLSATKTGTTSATLTFGANATSEMYQGTPNSSVAAAYTITAEVRSSTAKKFRFKIGGSGTVYYSANLQPTSDWQVFTFTSPAVTTSSDNISIANESSGGAGTIEVRYIDLRVANDGIGLPAYQRVDTATDYDYAGFPPYLKFDGVDDSMATGSIDFSATDKMSVFAGVRKLSASAYGIVCDTGTNNGSFTVCQDGSNSPLTLGSNWAVFVKGTTFTGYGLTTFNTPITNVLSVQMDIGGAARATELIPRVNGATPTLIGVDSADAGTGNFGNYPLYIGRRGGTSLPYNGRLYSLVVCGKLASAAEITATEAWVNQKTRAFA